MNSPIKYYGGKSYMTDIIISHFPKDYSVYIEGFGGASVLFAKEKDKLEIYNDLGRNVYSLFKVLSDEDLCKKMKDKLDLTYYSADTRKEFIEDLKRDDLSLLDRAYKYFYVNRSSFNGVGGFSTTLLVRRNMSKSVSDYLSAIDGLQEVHNRLSSVIIEHRNIFDLIEKYDDKNVFFYLDPPYVHDTRSSGTEYECEMSDEEHEKFVNMLLNGKGKFLISGYEHPIYDKLVDNGWNLYKYNSPNSNSDRIECLWYNYDIEEGDLFDD
jgi:DNA adenine methylase